MPKWLELVVLSLALPAHAEVACSWNSPGLDPFRGDRMAAVMSYSHIPLQDRLALAWRVRWGKPDHHVDILRTGIVGSPGIDYGDVRGMHFGRGRRCDAVDRSQWVAGHAEPAAVYRRGSTCVVVPTVCGNISLASCHDNGRFMEAGVTRRVPEPGTLLLTGLAICALIYSRRRY